jgi:hypothetical protein
MMRVEAVIFAASQPVSRETLSALIGSDCNLDLIIADIRAAKAIGQKDRLGSIRDLDAAAQKLKQACAVLLDETTSNAGVRRAVFSLVTRDELADAVAQIDNLTRPHDDLYFKELRAQHRRLPFMPALLRATTFGAAPAGRPILEAIEYVRTVLDEKRRVALVQGGGGSGCAALLSCRTNRNRRSWARQPIRLPVQSVLSSDRRS